MREVREPSVKPHGGTGDLRRLVLGRGSSASVVGQVANLRPIANRPPSLFFMAFRRPQAVRSTLRHRPARTVGNLPYNWLGHAFWKGAGSPTFAARRCARRFWSIRTGWLRRGASRIQPKTGPPATSRQSRWLCRAGVWLARPIAAPSAALLPQPTASCDKNKREIG
jgi:hypothetical protein